MDKLFVTGLKLSTLIGTLDWEQQVPQVLHCDLAFQTDAKHIALTDHINEAIDYDAVTLSVQAFVEKHHFQLIETLAEKLAHHILAHFPTSWVQITLHKPGALKQAKDVVISIERTRQ